MIKKIIRRLRALLGNKRGNKKKKNKGELPDNMYPLW